MRLSNHVSLLLVQSVLIATLLFITTGCTLLYPKGKVTIAHKVQAKGNIRNIKTLYIESFKGKNAMETRAILESAVQLQRLYKIAGILPTKNLESVGILKIEITEASSKDLEEDLADLTEKELQMFYGESIVSLGDEKLNKGKLIRRNALISLKVVLSQANDKKKILVNRTYTQPYQQIYRGETAIAKKKPLSLESDRLNHLVIAKFLRSINYKRTKTIIPFEFAGKKKKSYFWPFVESTIERGIRLAEGKNYIKAETIFTLLSHRMGKNSKKSFEVISKEKAQIYYNLGVIKQLQQKWEGAALMFSKANRLQQKMKYAQAWADSIQRWKDLQQIKVKGTNLIKPIQTIQKERIPSIEDQDRLLLDKNKLWPYKKLSDNES